MTAALVLAGVVVGAIVGWLLGNRAERPDPRAAELEGLARELSAGRIMDGGSEASPEVAALRHAVRVAWVPRNEEREQALREALGRIAAFLREHVEAPLRSASEAASETSEGSQSSLARAVATALGGLEDLEFFLREPLVPDETHDLRELAKQVMHEFTSDWNISVRLTAAAAPVRAHVHRATFMDAVYLLLHNAAQFADGQKVEIVVESEGNRARLRVVDRGPGFSQEALERAEDLFYTTTPTGLGLGIPFARRIVEGFGGDIRVGNRDGGGAEVTLELPSA